MSNILVTGSNGQLGHCLMYELNRDDIKKMLNDNESKIYFETRETIDITDYESICNFVKDKEIDYIINCAAYTKVDDAEDHYKDAYNINCNGSKVLANVCNEFGIRLIHISTDYVFNGESFIPYNTDDKVDPKTNYGGSKSLGETAISLSGCEYMIIRTSWLYSTYGKNFFNTMISLTDTKDTIKVVNDQVGSPTFANDLARFILVVVLDNRFKNGIYHFSNRGVCSWYDFSYMINKVSGHKCIVNPCSSEEFPTKAKRPHYSVLSTKKTEDDFNYQIPNWIDALERCFLELQNK